MEQSVSMVPLYLFWEGWFVCALIAGVLGFKKGEGAIFTLLGILVGPVAIIVVLFSKGLKTCPHCKEKIKKDASVCKFCNNAQA